MRIDLDHLRRFTGDNDTLLGEVLGMFSDQTESWLRALDPATDDDSWSGVAHALKGSAATVGATRLGELAARAESLVGDHADPTRREAVRAEIQLETDAVRADIARWDYNAAMRRLKDGG